MSRLPRPLRLLAACTRGAAAVEFAIVSGVLIMLLIGIVDLGRTLYIKNQISFLADRAARKILIDPDIPQAALETYLRDNFNAGNPDSLGFVPINQSVDGTTYRGLTINFPITLLIPNLVTDSIALSVSRRVPTS